MITIRYWGDVNWNGMLNNFMLDMNNIAKSGIRCDSHKFHISNGGIYNIGDNSIGLSIDNGYELLIDKLHFKACAKNSIGIRTRTSDCHFSNIILINCGTAIDNLGSNIYDKIHAWIAKGEYLQGSVFYKSRGGDSFLSQCCSDTYETCFEITESTLLMISQFKNYHNLNVWTIDMRTVKPEIFHFSNNSVASLSSIIMQNSIIGELKLKGLNYQKFSNLAKTPVETFGCIGVLR